MTFTERLAASIIALMLALALVMPALASHTLTEELETPAAEALEQMDRALAPLDARIDDLVADIGATSGGLSDAYVTALGETAVQAWLIVATTPYHSCSAQLVATLRVTYAIIADSVDDYAAKASDWRDTVGAAMYLWQTRVPLERSITTCEPSAPPTLTPVATRAPRPTPTATPGST